MLQGEGVAYRGRILVELSTILESKPDNKKLEMIPNDDLLVVEVNPFFFFLLSVLVIEMCLGSLLLENDLTY